MSINPHLRLRSIRFKDGGAVLHVLNNDMARPIAVALQRHVDDLKEAPDLAGYALVAWYNGGGTSTSVHNNRQGQERLLIPVICEAAIREYLTTI